MNFWGHLSTINHHKWLVMKHCFRVGLYKQGLLHDLSKYAPVEFYAGMKYYQGNCSPNEGERKEKGYSGAWLHHKGRNKHHMEYWLDYSKENQGKLSGVEMPIPYLAEMICDRVAASKTYLKDQYTNAAPWEYYQKNKSHYLIHPKTQELLEQLLQMLQQQGEEKTFAYLRKLVKESKK